MSRLAILASILALAAGSANCADDPAQANSLSGIAPSAMDSSSDATLSALAKGGRPTLTASDSTITLDPLSTDPVPHFGQDVTFHVHTSATPYPFVTVRCSQNDVQVYEQSLRMDLGTLYSRTFTLGPAPNWQSGAADCTGTLENWDDYSKNGKIAALASTAFSVAP